jgi:hypothetical protein
MIYLGVHFCRNAVNITALSDGFALLCEKHFYNLQSEAFHKWLDDLKTDPDEPVRCFVDESQFRQPAFPTHFFDSLQDEPNSLFLVNHRALSNLIQFFHEWLVPLQTPAPKIQIPLVLASANRIFDNHQLKQLLNHHDCFL